MVSIGKLKKRITIKRDTTVRDEVGDIVQNSETTVATRWAKVKPLTGKELTFAQQINAQISHEVRLRYDAGLNLTSEDRIIFDSRTLDIESVINVDERNKEFILMCKEQVA